MIRKIQIFIILFFVGIIGYLISYDTRKPYVIYYSIDELDRHIVGTVEDKYHVGQSYNLVINRNYFPVTAEQYESVNVGDKVIGFLTKDE